MNDIATTQIRGGLLEYFDESHLYVYEGMVLPSITRMLRVKFGHKYDGIDEEILKRAAELGNAVHKAIEDYEKLGAESDLKELHNYKFLKRAYGFECLDNEVPVILFRNDVPIACGRLDMVIAEGKEIGLGDIKRTATLDRDYLAYQLNLYRLAYMQSYEKDIKFLRGLHLRDDVRKYITLPVDESLANEIIDEYFKGDHE